MNNDNLSIVELIEKMENIAYSKYKGNAIDNIYSIYSMLTDIEKITFLKYSYKISASFLMVMEMADLSVDLARPVSIPTDSKRYVEDKKMDIEAKDKAELVNMKHRAIITAGQIVLLMLGMAFILVIMLTFISPNALKILKSLGPIIEAIIG